MSATPELLLLPEPAINRGGRPGLLRALVRRPGGIVGLVGASSLLAAGILGPMLAPHDPFAVDGPPLAAPSGAYPMGTDALGRDVLSGILHGARTSLTIVLGVGVAALLLGLLVGLVAGYRGGWVDDLLMRATESIQVLPRFFLALVVIAFFGPGLDRLVLLLGVTSWPLLARVVRAETLALREREFVDAARVAGASGARIVLREVLPHALAGALAVLGLVVAQALLLEAGLAFLGLGDPNALSWGTLASEAQDYLRVAWWLSLFPGLAILLAVLALNLLADALTDAVREPR